MWHYFEFELICSRYRQGIFVRGTSPPFPSYRQGVVFLARCTSFLALGLFAVLCTDNLHRLGPSSFSMSNFEFAHRHELSHRWSPEDPIFEPRNLRFPSFEIGERDSHAICRTRPGAFLVLPRPCDMPHPCRAHATPMLL